jgi:hypothetical protein
LACVAVAAHEALGEVSTREVALEGVLHVARQRRGIRRLGVRDEGGEVLADEAVQQGVLRFARAILRGRSGHGRAVGRRRHAARLAAGVPRDLSLFSRRYVHAAPGGAMAGGGANERRRGVDALREGLSKWCHPADGMSALGGVFSSAWSLGGRAGDRAAGYAAQGVAQALRKSLPFACCLLQRRRTLRGGTCGVACPRSAGKHRMACPAAAAAASPWRVCERRWTESPGAEPSLHGVCSSGPGLGPVRAPHRPRRRGARAIAR